MTAWVVTFPNYIRLHFTFGLLFSSLTYTIFSRKHPRWHSYGLRHLKHKQKAQNANTPHIKVIGCIIRSLRKLWCRHSFSSQCQWVCLLPSDTPKSNLHLVLSMWPCTLKLDEEKSKYAGLAQETGFTTNFLSLLRLVKGAAKLCTC